MNRRHAAQDAEAHIERRTALRVECGEERYRGRVVIDFEAQPVFEIERPRLFGNIRGRIVQPQVGRQIGSFVLGNDATGFVFQKFIDKDAIKTDESADRRRGPLAEAFD